MKPLIGILNVYFGSKEKQILQYTEQNPKPVRVQRASGQRSLSKNLVLGCLAKSRELDSIFMVPFHLDIFQDSMILI